jgi:hypothetical protein
MYKRDVIGICDICGQDETKPWRTPNGLYGGFAEHARTFRTGSDGLVVCNSCDWGEYGCYLPPNHAALLDQLSEPLPLDPRGWVQLGDAMAIEHVLQQAAKERE